MVSGRARGRSLIRLFVLLLGICALFVAGQRPAHAKGLTKEELSRLLRGEVVKREVTVDLPGGQYTGGVFRVKPLDDKRSLFTYSALLRLPFGIVKLLEDKIRSIALTTPARVRHYVEGRTPEIRLPGR